MRYVSTRGKAPSLNFADAVLAGLASDGGLYVPESYPQFSAAEMQELAALPYPKLAARIIGKFVGDSLDAATLERLTEEAYASFRHAAVAPLVQLDRNQWVLELFHGPTLAFKDFALQLLGRLLDHLLSARNANVTIVGATSGDTGSAAIAGVRGRNRMRSFILYPHGRISDVQRRQMTTVPDANVHAIAVEGSFDDCQRMVKEMFVDRAFCDTQKLAAVNSINWARVLAQVVYYFYATFALQGTQVDAKRPISFSVPTGNFGDIYAGYLARRMGLPIGDLVIATNQNDILTRMLHTGVYEAGSVTPSHSPSMDIQVASNFERLLFDACGRDAAWVDAQMQQFTQTRSLSLPANVHDFVKQHFRAERTDDAATVATIQRVYAQSGYVLDPHSAVGVDAGKKALADMPQAVQVTLATAHPAKFPATVQEAIGVNPALPPHMADLFDLPERITVLPADVRVIQEYIENAA
jgi:threonine synthase